MAVLTAVGTFVEAEYDQEWANKLVYHSFWMWLLMALLAVNLTMVLIDRWPWKKRHLPFILAHIGILIVLLGSLFTKYLGIDGSLRFAEGETANTLSVSQMEIKIYSSYDGENFRLLYESPVDMFFEKPSKQKPYLISAGGPTFLIDQYLPFAVGRESVQEVSEGGSPALRFHLFGSQADVVKWIQLDKGQKTKKESFGPAFITLTTDQAYKPEENKELVLFVKGQEVFYSLAGQQRLAQLLNKGELISTSWMDFQFRLIEFFPQAQKKFLFEPRDKPSDVTLKALRVRYEGETTWLGQNSYARFFKEDQVYAFAYLNKTYPLGFDLKLADFRIKKYQGSEKAKSYESLVHILKRELPISDKEVLMSDKEPSTPDKEVLMSDKEPSTPDKEPSTPDKEAPTPYKEVLISMNEPLKYKGWTLYQSSFEPSETGGPPKVSILSVNKDPGRFIKYAGSALVVLGVILLFYRRRMST